jgi:hypothetical protein
VTSDSAVQRPQATPRPLSETTRGPPMRCTTRNTVPPVVVIVSLEPCISSTGPVTVSDNTVQ